MLQIHNYDASPSLKQFPTGPTSLWEKELRNEWFATRKFADTKSYRTSLVYSDTHYLPNNDNVLVYVCLQLLK